MHGVARRVRWLRGDDTEIQPGRTGNGLPAVGRDAGARARHHHRALVTKRIVAFPGARRAQRGTARTRPGHRGRGGTAGRASAPGGRAVGRHEAEGRSRPEKIGARRRPAAAGAAYVPLPALPQTQPPKGFVDFSDSRPISAANPGDARAAFEKLQRCDNGPMQYLVTTVCYPDGSGKYNCQARLRCPLRSGPGGARQE
jgi:hypothetical protein